MPPLLSICIPTLNRAELLNDQLTSLEQQVGPFMDRLEIVVADNASKDNTAEVVANSSLPLVYGRQEETLGFTKNVLFVTTDLASGDYIWLIGDDDLVLPGAIEKIFDSIEKAPDVDYHYLNFGWVNVQKRTGIIHQQQGQPDPSLLNRLQFNHTDWQRLEKLEDLTLVDSDNISAAFSGIFCFVVKRHYFVDGKSIVSPSDSLDGSSTNMSDCFPHAMITLPPIAGKPIAYVGSPCLMQGISGWEWGSYAYKNMILGTYQLFDWLETTAFDKASLGRLWTSYFQMAGRLFLRMQDDPEEHKGMELVMEEAIPFCASNQTFWDAFLAEGRMFAELSIEVSLLAEQVKQTLESTPDAQIGLWGIAGRGMQLIKHYPEFSPHLKWVTDKSIDYHHLPFLNTGLAILPPDTLHTQDIDILVIATRREFINDVKAFARTTKPEILTVSLSGTEPLQ